MVGFLIVISILLATVLPCPPELAIVIKYLVFISFLLTLLDIKITRAVIINGRAIAMYAVMIGIGYALYFILSEFNATLALIAFVVAITPTSMYASMITSIFKGDVGLTTSNVVVSNCACSLLLPVMLNNIPSATTSLVSVETIMATTLTLIFVPILISAIMTSWCPNLTRILKRLQPYNVYLFVFLIYILTSNSVNYFNQAVNDNELEVANIVLVAFMLLIANLLFGAWFGGKRAKLEMQQSFVQRNNGYTAYIAIAYLSPTVSLGIVCYMVFQCLYCSYRFTDFKAIYTWVADMIIERRDRSLNRISASQQ